MPPHNTATKKASSTTAAVGSTTSSSAVDNFNDLMRHMADAKEEYLSSSTDPEGTAAGAVVDVDDPEALRDKLLGDAIDFALEQGRGWGPGEKEAYLEKIRDDDYLPPLFATSVEDVEKSGLKDAFTSLIYEEESPTALALRFKDKGRDAFLNGNRNQSNNLQYYRDAINHYYESLAWAEKIVPLQPGDYAQADTDEPTYTPTELAKLQSDLIGNVALLHLKLRNWGLARDEAQRAIDRSSDNVKAWYRLAQAQQHLQQWEAAGEAADSGLAIEPTNPDLRKLRQSLDSRARRARTDRQRRERERAERAARTKAAWMHAKRSHIRLGRTSLLATRYRDNDHDDDCDGAAPTDESSWQQHHGPHAGALPRAVADNDTEWTWPVLFVYPSHRQSDFIEQFRESDLLAVHMARVFPEPDDDDPEPTTHPVSWDHNRDFKCSQLAVYFEVHGTDPKEDSKLVHPESVEVLHDLATCRRHCEAARALRGDEGPETADVVRALERKRLGWQAAAWKERHGSLWATPDPCPVVRVHPAATLRDALTDARMIVPNVSSTFALPI